MPPTSAASSTRSPRHEPARSPRAPRGRTSGPGGPRQRAAAEDMLTGALRSLFAVAEAYPQLQAVQEFKDLSENLRDTEDKIQFARRFYNAQVRDYNTALQIFPTVLLAGAMGFTASQYFEVESPSDREVPKVSFTPSA